jgi:multiple sugar transport system permease protein
VRDRLSGPRPTVGDGRVGEDALRGGPVRPVRSATHDFWRRYRVPYLFVSAAVLLVLLVSLYPILYAVRLSLYETEYLRIGRFVGLANFVRAALDPRIQHSVGASLMYVFGSLALVLPIGLGLALLLNRPIRFRTVFRTVLIVPWIVSQTVTAMLWAWLLNPNFGPVNYLLATLGVGRVMFVANPGLAMKTLIVANVWQSYPYAMILLLAALQTIPEQLYEAARIDGASPARCFRFVTLPMISNVLLVVVIMCSLHYFNMVTLMYVLTGGGPVFRTETLSLTVFLEAFTHWDMSLASTVGIAIFVCNVGFSLLYIRLLRREALY